MSIRNDLYDIIAKYPDQLKKVALVMDNVKNIVVIKRDFGLIYDCYLNDGWIVSVFYYNFGGVSIFRSRKILCQKLSQ